MSTLPSGLVKNLVNSLWLLIALTSHAVALPEDRLQPVNIEADNALLSQQTNQTVYKGNVVLTQGSLRIEADEIIITVLEGALDTVAANGQQASLFQVVRAESPPILAKADNIFFDVDDESLLLEGTANVEHGESRFEGNRIEYRMGEETVTAQERVRMTIPTINSQ